ncbi:MAG: type II toxin-antitoxin system VapC family toxin [Tessaracoccus sp.]|uniref:type II toxin-antitoxin system VapC family toxin n=1 Tax=Tessaracoccus sp. TaxID=1971211 RepID=UPI001EC580DE|nr:type II toxin-antitoxin system VapC family toxin [Tessaracoccus sp.]MBK7822781.1 type II toxin-antitoxin system VapC family toxin [Tessaracoccus sp.]
MSVVLDASIVTELLVLSPLGERAAPLVRATGGDVHVPHLLDMEVMSVLRGLVLGGILTETRASYALTDLRDFPARRWPATVFFERIWELRGDVTAYDANHVALAEALDAQLITSDARLARALDGIARCGVTLVA